MENKNKEILLDKIDELVSLIQNNKDYKKYCELKEKMKSNEKIMSLIKEIKREEQTIVNKEYNKEDTSLNEKKLNALFDELNAYPIYNEYNYLGEDINNMLQNIKSIIEKEFNKKEE